MTYKAGIVGAAGFAGIELARLVLAHPSFELVAATSDALAGTPLAKAYPAFAGVTDLAFSTHAEANLSACDVVFLAVPHTAALGMAPALIAQGVTVVDLSADFRLKDPQTYERWYKTPHTAADLLRKAAFGLPELTGDELARASAERARGGAALVGCAGCYPTATSLAAAPAIRAGLVDAQGVVVVDAVSGVTGAGKKATERTHFCFANENLEAYGVATHRHTPEIEQILGLRAGGLVFTPHLAPLNRGLLSTVTMPLSPDAPLPSTSELVQLYRDFYASSPLVTVMPEGQLPKTASVAGTNRAHVGVVVHEAARMIVGIGAIDNIGKGAAGQALQCANIVFGLPETTGLDYVSVPV
ncbi:N-acetyl-gamma-glutamyl-phosphate reductase [Adlercreutzia sp. ZJ242]|uniref:N-acetyl-gamma-glutamyl-phosphate reductase n=1 Tax=Adlercreutzia sp. ZJ242 TaxID=2709409 RepID=UPI0013EA6C8D|nr:N-acetyl-gamma-glutamyl-phosphate reductase [Adlercreutzia sp. ZJ242]